MQKEAIKYLQRNPRCPGGVCTLLFYYYIGDTCNGCGACKKMCPVGAIVGEKKQPHVICYECCSRCGVCWDVCPKAAIEKLADHIRKPNQYCTSTYEDIYDLFTVKDLRQQLDQLDYLEDSAEVIEYKKKLIAKGV